MSERGMKVGGRKLAPPRDLIGMELNTSRARFTGVTRGTGRLTPPPPLFSQTIDIQIQIHVRAYIQTHTHTRTNTHTQTPDIDADADTGNTHTHAKKNQANNTRLFAAIAIAMLKIIS